MQARFLSRDEYAQHPAELHSRSAALGCLTISEQEAQLGTLTLTRTRTRTRTSTLTPTL